MTVNDELNIYLAFFLFNFWHFDDDNDEEEEG